LWRCSLSISCQVRSTPSHSRPPTASPERWRSTIGPPRVSPLDCAPEPGEAPRWRHLALSRREQPWMTHRVRTASIDRV
jgi:hypothetical protein